MNNQDREEALGRLLTATQQQNHSQATPACLDAEGLAAWIENQLTTAQRSAAESHVASCARCQAILSAMARTADAAAAAAPEGERSGSWVFRFAPWLAALGGAAAVAAIVVATLPGTEQAPNAPVPDTLASRADRLEAAKESPAAADALASVNPNAAPVAAAPVPAAPAESSREREEKNRVPRALAKDTEARQNASLRDQAAKQEKALQPLARDERDVKAVPAPVPPPQAPAAAPPPVVTPVGERPPENQAFGASRRAAAVAETITVTSAVPVFIQSPDAKIRWRIVGGTVVQRSADAGATWTTQDAKVEAPVVAGSAPTATVCWVVGQQGTVLVTADGRTWQRLTPPAAIDLIAVVATSADTATVTAADGRSFTTADRGRTWR